jgi:predicted RNA binding protein YcfA (HicA-like mRNA interferase family)
MVMQKGGESGTTTVPVPDHAELRTGTMRSMIRQSGIPREEFES